MVVFDVNNLKLLCQKKITECIRAVGSGEKHLVIQGSLMRPLDRMCGAGFLKSCGIGKIFRFDDYCSTITSVDENTHVIFLLRSEITILKQLKRFIEIIEARRKVVNLHSLIVPRMSEAFKNLFEMEGLYDIVSCIELPLEFLPLDVDLVSLELPDLFKEFMLCNDFSNLTLLSSALWEVEGFFGIPHTVFSLGSTSKLLSDMMASQHSQEKLAHDDGDSDIDIVILMDRSEDLVSPLLSPLTFQGALDDHFGINCCYMEFKPPTSQDASKVQEGASGKGQGDTSSSAAPTILTLGPEIEVFAQAKDLHFAQVSEFVRAKLQELDEIKESKSDLKGINDLKNFVANDLKKFQNESNILKNLLAAVDMVIAAGKHTRVKQLQIEQSIVARGSYERSDLSYLESLFCQQVPIEFALRNVCLFSVASGGFSSSDLKMVKTRFLHCYGYEHLLTFNSLEQAGLVVCNSDPTTKKLPGFSTWAKKLGCLANPNAANEGPKFDNPYYATNGTFCPLIYRVLEFICTNKGEEISKLYGATFQTRRIASQGHRRDKKVKSIIICLVGGLTYLECAIVRLFAVKFNVNVLITASSMINSKRFLKPLIENIDNSTE